MKKITLMAAVAAGLVGAASAATIYDASPANTLLDSNDVAGSETNVVVFGSPGALEFISTGGTFFDARMGSVDNIHTLIGGGGLTAIDTVQIQWTVDSVVFTNGTELRSRGIYVGLSTDATDPSVQAENLILRVGGGGNSGNAAIQESTSFSGSNGQKASVDSTVDGFGVTLVANAAGWEFSFTDITTGAGVAFNSISGTFTDENQFLDVIGGGHFYTTFQHRDTDGAPAGATTLNISEASIDVFVQTDPELEFAPTALSLELFAPDASTTGTITAAYGEVAGSSADIEIVSLVASNGFSVFIDNTTLGLANTNEDITVTFTNSVGLTNIGDVTNSPLIVTWTVEGSGATNTSDVALDVSYYPYAPVLPDHGLVLFEAATDNTTLINNANNGNDANITLTGATPDLLLANDGGDFFAGGFAGTETIETLQGMPLTSNDTVMISLTVDSVSHTDSSQLRSRGIEFGISADATFSGGGSSSNFIVKVGGAGNGTNIQLADNSSGTITSAVFRATEASVADGFSTFIVANEAGFTIYFDGLLTTTGGPMYPVSGTFTNGHFASAFGVGHYYASMQKRLAGTTTLDISDATLSVTATAAPVITGTGVLNGDFVLEFTGTLGREYTVETKGDLVNGTWGMETNIPSLPESPMTVELPTTDPAAFYRVVIP